MAQTTIRRALLSVSNKEGLLEFARGLRERGVALLSTGGTAALLREAGIEVTDVAEVTGFPEIMDGRVKTLHPKIHGGLLGRRGVDDAVMAQHGIDAIDLVAVNLYPFAATIARPGCTFDDAVENIDIGGPAMVRASAKNHDRVTIVVDPLDYGTVLAEIDREGGGVPAETRLRLATKAFAHTAQYDAAVASYLGRAGRNGAASEFPDLLALQFRKRLDLRYGENPHQQAAFYVATDSQGASVGSASQLQGKELSYNNLLDADTALECVRQFEAPACVIVKHANPCGVAVAASPREAYDRAFRTDPTSAFGGIIAFNRPLDGETARVILERQFVEVIVAPAVDPEAREACARKENVRLLVTGGLAASNSRFEIRSVNGGLLLQGRDTGLVRREQLRVVSKRVPSPAELDDLLFAWTVCKYVKSNAIVFARDGMTVGVGAGQMSRVVSTRIAAMKARDEGLEPRGSVMASDAFFPFRDGLDAAAEHGIVAVIQPGGSKRDAEVIAAADEHGIAMVFTGMRHFRHLGSSMKVLIIGSGGREHALAWKVAQSPRVTEVQVAPGNAGTALEPRVRNVEIAAEDVDGLLRHALAEQIDLTIVGPEGPLVLGICDAFAAAGLRCFGPSRNAAQLEGSKAFTKDFLRRHRIPTAAYGTFTRDSFDPVWVRAQRAPLVVKADGLAAGKGVVICATTDEAVATTEAMFAGRFGKAGDKVVIEEFLEGEEASFIAMVDGTHVLPLATSQDHKRLRDGDQGPNTGGMGAYSPAPVVTAAVHERAMREVMWPTVRALAAEGTPYVGFLYAGLMIAADGTPKVLEFNCRLGDPETQPILARLRSDLTTLCEAALDGRLAEIDVDWDPRAAVGVVLAAGGYPEAVRKGDVIHGLEAAARLPGKVFHAGTATHGGEVVTSGGRVLCAVGLGATVRDARAQAYGLVEAISWDGLQYRRDIGYRAVAREESRG